MKKIIIYICYTIALVAASIVILHIKDRGNFFEKQSERNNPEIIAERHLPWVCCEYCNDYKNGNDAMLAILVWIYDAEHYSNEWGEYKELYAGIVGYIMKLDDEELLSIYVNSEEKSYVTSIQKRASEILPLLKESYLTDDPYRLFVYYLNFPEENGNGKIKLDFSNSNFSDGLAEGGAKASEQLRIELTRLLHEETTVVTNKIKTLIPRRESLIDYAYMASSVYSCEELTDLSDKSTKVYEVIYQLNTEHLKNSESGYWQIYGLEQPKNEYVLCTMTVYENGKSKLSLEDHSYKLSELI